MIGGRSFTGEPGGDNEPGEDTEPGDLGGKPCGADAGFKAGGGGLQFRALMMFLKMK